MLISEMIEQLTALQNKLGDVEVLITDGYESRGYRGDFQIKEWYDFEGTGQMTVDIGIGGLCETS
jgi:hypothetical protein